MSASADSPGAAKMHAAEAMQRALCLEDLSGVDPLAEVAPAEEADDAPTSDSVGRRVSIPAPWDEKSDSDRSAIN
jgi:hypothetical protein